MLTDYIKAAMSRAEYEILEDDNSFVGTIPGCQGVWANEETQEACRIELQSALEDWILVRINRNLTLPILDGLDLNLSQQEVA